MIPDYTLLDHTADFGLEVRAADEASLIASAILAITDAMFGLDSVVPSFPVSFQVLADDPEMRLVLALSEAIFRIDADGILPAEVSVAAAAEGAWTIRMRCDLLDPARHRHRIVFKAVTFHGLEVLETPTGWIGHVVLDA
jgi:SHS2 domain-containing protein